MEYTIDYLLESLPDAARTLAVEPGDARERVARAYSSIHHLAVERMPESLRNDLQWVKDQLTKRDPRQQAYQDAEGNLYEDPNEPDGFAREGTIQANLRTMKRKTAAKIADRMFTIYLKTLSIAYQPRPGTHRRLHN